MMNRRNFLNAGAALCVLSACGRRASDGDMLDKAKALIAARPSLDLHAHPGRTFVLDARQLSPTIQAYVSSGAFEMKAVDDMRSGGMNAAVFAAVADLQLLDFAGTGLVATRSFEPGEALASYQRQIANLDTLFATGLAEPIRTPSDITKAISDHSIGAVLGVEGGDFLEGSTARVEEAFEDGVRCITLVHYHTNEIGDIMTANPVHDGLTAAGADVVRTMNRAGIIVDLAHASEATAFGMLEASNKPVICSHTHIRTETFDFPRFISLDLAREIANSGGIIGAWPAGIGISDLDGYVDRVFELVDFVGVDHVGIGTDMDANYEPVWDNYRQFPDVVARMFKRGMHEEEIAKIIGGNGMRVFTAVSG